MRPREFDELIVQKFDRNDFEYDPQNWDELASRLDDSKKRQPSFIVWFMPLLGMAASITVALAIPTVMRMAQPATTNTRYATTDNGKVDGMPSNNTNTLTDMMSHTATYQRRASGKDHHTGTNSFRINYDNAISGSNTKTKKTINLLAQKNINEQKKNEFPVQPMHTFKHDDEAQKAPKFSLNILGGVNYSGQANGFVIGATTRRMINDRLFIEGDIAFLSSNNSSQNEYYAISSGGHSGGNARTIGNTTATARTESTESAIQNNNTPTYTQKTSNANYSLFYAEVSPALGYKLSKKLSIGGGPDFQQMLVDNRPAIPETDRNNISVAPVFDIGLLGKTEYAVCRKIKAAVYVREGINNILTPMNKYTDRNYMQFQIKYTLFDK